MLGTFPKDFSQVAIPQGYFPKWQLPKCAISKRQLPKSVLSTVLGPKPVLAAALEPLAHPSRSDRPHCNLRSLKGPNLTFGKLPLGKFHILESCHLGNFQLGKYLTPKI